MCEAFLVERHKISVVPHGIAARFLEADPDLFRQQLRSTGPFALMVGRIAPYNNQLAVARALAGLALPLVVIGEARERDASYLRELQDLRTVRCLGPLAYDDPLLASAYAAASVFVLASTTAGAPMAAAEALAAGTPVVSRIGNDIQPREGDSWLHLEGRDDPAALQRAVSALLAQPPQRAAVRATMRHRSWQSVALDLAQCYRRALAPAGLVLA
jgi:glycosyltransferase involved in cell wall biosynthesis